MNFLRNGLWYTGCGVIMKNNCKLNYNRYMLVASYMYEYSYSYILDLLETRLRTLPLELFIIML